MKTSFVFILIVILLEVQVNDGWWRRRRRRRRRRTPPRDCKLSVWSSWSRCTHECGNAGTQSRIRHKLENECCGGRCWPLKETRSCNRNCRNGGIPLFGKCLCKGGYTGTCCETGVYDVQFACCRMQT